MDYTIAILKDIQGSIEVNFDRSGNKYIVGLCNTDTKEYTYKKFSSHIEAMKIFQWFATVICSGDYSYEDRREALR